MKWFEVSVKTEVKMIATAFLCAATNLLKTLPPQEGRA